MEHLILETEIRERTGTGFARKLRREGCVPAVLYGLKQETLHLQVKEKDFELVLRSGGENAVIDLKVTGSGDSTFAVIKDRQFDPVWGKLLHIDFYRVSMTEKLSAEVPVVTVGESAGEKAGGTVEHILREVTVECLPDRIPENIEVDVTALEIGNSIHARDLSVQEGVEIITEPDRVVISVIAPRVVEEEVVAEEAVEPELVGEKKEAGEEAGEEKEEKGKEEKGEERKEGKKEEKKEEKKEGKEEKRKK